MCIYVQYIFTYAAIYINIYLVNYKYKYEYIVFWFFFNLICPVTPAAVGKHKQQTEESSVRHGSVSLPSPQLLHHPWTSLRPKARGRKNSICCLFG